MKYICYRRETLEVARYDIKVATLGGKSPYAEEETKEGIDHRNGDGRFCQRETSKTTQRFLDSRFHVYSDKVKQDKEHRRQAISRWKFGSTYVVFEASVG